MQPLRPETPIIFLGQEHEVTLPSGNVVRIRETNGDDDEILSRLGAAQDGSNIINFLTNITEHDSALGRKPHSGDLMEWPLADKYYLLFKQRLLNHGNLLKFQHKFENSKHELDANPVTFEQDVAEFDGNLADPLYKPSTPHQPKKYPYGNQREVEYTTSSGVQVKWKILNTILENKQLSMPLESTNRNSALTIRELSVFNKGEWVRLTTFGMFSSKVMSELRTEVGKSDPSFNPIVDVVSPNSGTRDSIPLIAIPDFYFPEGQI